MRNNRKIITLSIVLSLYILPLILAIALIIIGRVSGCQLVGEDSSQCQIIGINFGENIGKLIKFSFNFPILTAMPLVYFLNGFLLILFIHQLWQKWVSRIVAVSLSLAYIGLAPSVLATIVVLFLVDAGNCTINEGLSYPCFVFGVDQGKIFYNAAVIPWVWFFIFPMLLVGIIAVYMIYVFIVISIKSKRSQ